MRISYLVSITRNLYTYNILRCYSLKHFKVIRPSTNSTTIKPIRMPPVFTVLSNYLTTQFLRGMSYPVQKSDEEWQAILSIEQFGVLRKQGTEAPFVGKYYKHMPDKGIYKCAGCNASLYKASHKFNSSCGWPAYYNSIPGAVTRHLDRSLGMSRTEIVCTNCGGHLGHVFKGEGYKTPTDERHCVNSISLKFSPDDPMVDK